METEKPVLLEPIVLLTVSIPDESMGDVIGDLVAAPREGAGLGSQGRNYRDQGPCAHESEVLRYAPDLRSMTGGCGLLHHGI